MNYRCARLRSFELIFNPALVAAALLILNRIIVLSGTKTIIPPASLNPPISPTVNTLLPLMSFNTCGNRSFSDVLMKRIWQLVASALVWNALTTSG